MSHLATTETRPQGPYIPTTCPYCSAKIEFLSPQPRVDALKIKCSTCGRRSLVNPAHPAASSRLTIPLPAETINSILRLHTRDSSLLFTAALVSRFWNACATPILYGDVSQSWDSRMTSLVHASPDRLSLVRTLDITFLRLERWVHAQQDQDLRKIFTEEFERIEGPERKKKRGGYVDRDRIDEKATKLARPRWLEEVRRRGAGDWMDLEDGEGKNRRKNEPRRRKGALALVSLASRSPRLRSLSVFEFDFGVVPGKELGPLPSLESVEELTIKAVDEWTQCLLLLRTPNLQKLAIIDSDPGSHLDPDITLPAVRHITYVCLDVREVPQLVSLLDACPSLRDLSLTVDPWDPVKTELARILLHAPHLKSLALDAPVVMCGAPSPHPGASLLAALATFTSLRHLQLPCHLSPSILASLPISLISLKTRWRNYDDDLDVPRRPVFLSLPAMLEGLIASKRKPLHLGLKQFTIDEYALHAPLEPSVVALIEAAKEVGVEIKIEFAARSAGSRSVEYEDDEEAGNDGSDADEAEDEDDEGSEGSESADGGEGDD